MWKKVACRPSTGKPVLGKNVKRLFGKNGITVRAVFTMSDVDAHIFPLDVFITEVADFIAFGFISVIVEIKVLVSSFVGTKGR